MKHFYHFFLCLVMAACAACTSPGPPSPPIVQPPTGVYFITEYDAPGHVHRMWTVPTFTERDFPRSVTFETADGQTITLTGSYQIDEEQKQSGRALEQQNSRASF